MPYSGGGGGAGSGATEAEINAILDTILGSEFDGTPDLYDILVTGGIPAWAAAAAPANNISIAQVIRQIYNEVANLDGDAMRGTDSAALASSWTAALATALGNYTAARAGYLDELGSANIPSDVDTLKTAVGSEFDGTPNIYDVEVTGYDSTAITSNEDGSILERLEWLQQNFGRAQTDDDMDASTTAIVSEDLAGFGDDYFNQGWKLGVILNDDSHGNAPENEWRDITDYDSGTGTFTCSAFSQNVEADDYIMVARDEVVKTFQATQRAVHNMTFWSVQDDEITLTTTSTADHALPSITIAGLPTGITLLRVIAILKIGLIRDTSTSNNAINGATTLQVDADVAYGSLTPAITIPDNSWKVVVATSPDRGGDVMIGETDVKTEITGNGTFYARLENCACDGNNLLLEDVQWGLQVYFTL